MKMTVSHLEEVLIHMEILSEVSASDSEIKKESSLNNQDLDDIRFGKYVKRNSQARIFF